MQEDGHKIYFHAIYIFENIIELKTELVTLEKRHSFVTVFYIVYHILYMPSYFIYYKERYFTKMIKQSIF
jgi:hypothetical protein